MRSYRYFDLVMAGFVTVLLCSNLIGPAKTCEIPLPFLDGLLGGLREIFSGSTGAESSGSTGGASSPAKLVFGAGNLFFPISYIFGDILTEVYGYARARKVIWAGFGAMVFASIMSQVVIRMPPAASEPLNQIMQPAIETVFGNTWRIVVGSILAFWAGDFVNSFVLAKMKILTAGRFLWMRTIGSTFAGQAVDSLIFYPLAFYGIWEAQTLAKVVLFNWCMKVSVEVVFTPVTYAVVRFLKRAENEDHYDRGTNFTPFSLKD